MPSPRTATSRGAHDPVRCVESPSRDEASPSQSSQCRAYWRFPDRLQARTRCEDSRAATRMTRQNHGGSAILSATCTTKKCSFALRNSRSKPCESARCPNLLKPPEHHGFSQMLASNGRCLAILVRFRHFERFRPIRFGFFMLTCLLERGGQLIRRPVMRRVFR